MHTPNNKPPRYSTETEALAAPGKIVRHYKGGIYRIIDEDARHSETLEEGVVYEHLWPNPHGFWFRPKSLFWRTIEPEKGGGSRFTLVKES
jgi:hypothetical protein